MQNDVFHDLSQPRDPSLPEAFSGACSADLSRCKRLRLALIGVNRFQARQQERRRKLLAVDLPVQLPWRLVNPELLKLTRQLLVANLVLLHGVDQGRPGELFPLIPFGCLRARCGGRSGRHWRRGLVNTSQILPKFSRIRLIRQSCPDRVPLLQQGSFLNAHAEQRRTR